MPELTKNLRSTYYLIHFCCSNCISCIIFYRKLRNEKWPIFCNRDKLLILQNFAKMYVWNEQKQFRNNGFLTNKIDWKEKSGKRHSVNSNPLSSKNWCLVRLNWAKQNQRRKLKGTPESRKERLIEVGSCLDNMKFSSP